jgi:6-phosphogluconolactonase
LGSITAHNAISRDGKRLFIVNYAVGEGGPDQSLAIYDIRADGSLSPAVASVAHRGKGPNASRQERAHAHSVTEVADNLVVVADLGLDQLVAYRISADGTPVRLAVSHTAPGAGPRHLAIHPNGRFVFVMNELDSTVSAHALDPDTGTLTLIQALPAVPAAARESNHCSDIQISPDGRFLYGANRGHDSIAVFSVDAETGHLTALGHAPCGGATPRNLALTPSGRHLLAANQNADRVTILRRDGATGLLEDTGASIAIGTPMCLKFAKGRV